MPSFPHVFISFNREIGIGTLGGCNPFLGAYEHGSIICTHPFLNLDAARTRSPTMRIAMDPPRARVHPPKRAFSAGHAALPRLSFAWDDHSGLQCRLVDASSMRFSHTWWWSDAWRRPSFSHTSRPIGPRGAREGPRRHTHLRGPCHGTPSVHTGGSYRSLQRILVPRSPEKIGPRGRDPPLRPSTTFGRFTAEKLWNFPSRWPGLVRVPQRIAPAHPNLIGPFPLSSVSNRTRIRFLSNPKETGSGGRSSSWDEVFSWLERALANDRRRTFLADWRATRRETAVSSASIGSRSERRSERCAERLLETLWTPKGGTEDDTKGIRVEEAKRVVRPQLRRTLARGISRLRQRKRFRPVGYAENDAVRDEETTNWRGLAQNRQWIKASHQDDSSGEIH